MMRRQVCLHGQMFLSRNRLFVLTGLLFTVLCFGFNYHFISKEFVYFWNDKNNNFENKDNGFIFFEKKIKENKLKKEKADIDANGKEETYVLRNGKLTVFEESNKVWESPDNWKITDFILADSTNDGVLDLNLSLWKPGNFGPSKPFWVKENDMSVKNHFFVFSLAEGSLKQVWGSSNLSNPNCEFEIADVDADGKNDLIVIEGEYLEDEKCVGKNMAVWYWNGWGFSNKWRSEDGIFFNLSVLNNEIKVYSKF